MEFLEYVSESELEWTINWVFYKFWIDNNEAIGVTHKIDWSELFSDWTRYASIEELLDLSNNDPELLKYRFNRIILIDKYGNSELIHIDANINDSVRVVETNDNSLQEKMNAVYVPDDEIVETDIIEPVTIIEEDFNDRISFVKAKIKETETLLLEANFSYENERLYQRERDELTQRISSLNTYLKDLNTEILEYNENIVKNQKVNEASIVLESELWKLFPYSYEEDYENEIFWFIIDMDFLYVGSRSERWYREYQTSVDETYYKWNMAVKSLNELIAISESEEDSWEDYVVGTLTFSIVESDIKMVFKNKKNGNTAKSITIKYKWHDWYTEEDFDGWQLFIED